MSPPLAFSAVQLRHPGRGIVLDHVSFALQPGEFVGLFGGNGAGKTTLLRAALGLVRPSRGAIEVFGQPARPGAPGLSYLPQTGRAAPPPIRAFDVLAASGTRKHAAEALALTGAQGLAARRLSQLSGGERQRVLLAQAIMGAPRLLLLDEPLAGLDPRHQAETAALLQSLQRTLGAAILCSAHELNVLLPFCNRVLYLAGGKAVIGDPDEVVTSPVLSGLYGAPVSVLRDGGRVFIAA